MFVRFDGEALLQRAYPVGAAVMAAALPDRRVLLVALLYAAGAHGIAMRGTWRGHRWNCRAGAACCVGTTCLSCH